MIDNIINWLLSLKGNKSRQTAKDRMKFMVIHDRQQLPPAEMEKMEKELLEVMARYYDIDTDKAEIVIQSNDDRSAYITTNVPLKTKSKNKKKSKQTA